MVLIKTPEEIQHMREGGRRLAKILQEVVAMALPGVTTSALEKSALEKIAEGGDTPAFLHYLPEGAPYPFPAALCVSVNSEVVHGIPREDCVLKEGDIVSLDLGLKHQGVFLDHACTVAVGKSIEKDAMLLRATREALHAGIAAIAPGAHVGDIGNAIENVAHKYGLGIIRDLSGHGVGREIHEDPYIPNYGKKGKGVKLAPGMAIAIEPMFSLGSEKIVVLPDGYTIETKDGSRAAHFEHTVLITETGFPEILTK